jgi:tetratricopeptide (TPR) repeat protein
MRVRYLTLAAVAALGASTVAAQSASERIRAGDAAQSRLQPAEALRHYESAIAADSGNYEALWKAAGSAIDLAEFEENKRTRRRLFRLGERLAERAVAVNPQDAEGHFTLARALGRVALTVGVRERVRYATEIRAQALDALRLKPEHPGALHVMGMWNAEIMRVSGVSRFFARTFLGAEVFDAANWDDAVRYMERAVEVDPLRLVHHLDLAAIYADIDDKASAREHFAIVVKSPPRDYNDRFYKEQARDQLKKLGRGREAKR